MTDTIPKLLKESVSRFGDLTVQLAKDESGVFQPTTYRQLYEEVAAFAVGLRSVGVRRGDHVGLISDNRKEWLIADLAIIGLGAADVPRGCDSMEHEIKYILGFSDCRIAIAENDKQVEKIYSGIDSLPVLSTIIVLDPDFDPVKRKASYPKVKLLHFRSVLERGKGDLQAFEREIALGKPDDLVTIIFTSGTTGEPKGVMLTNENFLCQIRVIPQVIVVHPGDIWLAVLPVWHCFERIIQYVVVGTGSCVAYSKPVSQTMLADFAAVRPMWMCSVPRIWEAVQQGVYRNVNAKGVVAQALFHFFVAVGGLHATLLQMARGLVPRFKPRSRLLDAALAAVPLALATPLKLLGHALVFKAITKRLGGRFVAAISGGGALPSAVDRFFQAAGVVLLEGYGLTESAPVLSVRVHTRPVPGTVGPALPGTLIKLVDEEGRELPPGRKGLIMAKGNQVMRGYYKRDDLTRGVLSEDGWLNTGDLGMMTRDGELKIMGRAKDTIVLLGGENIEPAPMEEKLRESQYIAQAVVLGQDQKYLAALIVPNMENLLAYAKEHAITDLEAERLVSLPEITRLIGCEVNELISAKNGFKSFEQLYRFKLLHREFAVRRELSHKQEVMRFAINDLYKKEISELFARG